MVPSLQLLHMPQVMSVFSKLIISPATVHFILCEVISFSHNCSASGTQNLNCASPKCEFTFQLWLPLPNHSEVYS